MSLEGFWGEHVLSPQLVRAVHAKCLLEPTLGLDLTEFLKSSQLHWTEVCTVTLLQAVLSGAEPRIGTTTEYDKPKLPVCIPKGGSHRVCRSVDLPAGGGSLMGSAVWLPRVLKKSASTSNILELRFYAGPRRTPFPGGLFPSVSWQSFI